MTHPFLLLIYSFLITEAKVSDEHVPGQIDLESEMEETQRERPNIK